LMNANPEGAAPLQPAANALKFTLEAEAPRIEAEYRKLEDDYHEENGFLWRNVPFTKARKFQDEVLIPHAAEAKRYRELREKSAELALEVNRKAKTIAVLSAR